MKLIKWRTEQGLTQIELARRLGVSGPTISSWEVGGKKPGARTMQRISALTGGAVLPNDFYDLSHISPDARAA